ncbi:hypothetical protein EVAR_87173_1 [Eumeta japonica]|uniref:Uncharacterized protein n=1 Tax=Eumeta variegata TaxID=151549 RepID=A0A4C1VW53_EUMVA|nr:hypothetical protein EVAR_87173_1 [Eumeta japonica]
MPAAKGARGNVNGSGSVNANHLFTFSRFPLPSSLPVPTGLNVNDALKTKQMSAAQALLACRRAAPNPRTVYSVA